MTRTSGCGSASAAGVRVGVVEAEKRREPGVVGRDVIHEQELERLDQPRAGPLCERRGAALALRHELRRELGRARVR